MNDHLGSKEPRNPKPFLKGPLQAVGGSWLWLTKRQKATLILYASARTLVGVLDILAIYMIGVAATVALESSGPGPKELVGADWIPSNPMWLFTIAAILLSLRTILSLVISRSSYKYLASIETDFSSRIIDYTLGESVAEIRSRSTADTEWIILRSTQTAFSGLLGQFVLISSDFLLALILIIFLFYQSWQITLFAIVLFTFLFVSLHILSHAAVSGAGKQFAESSLEVVKRTSDFVSAYREIFVSGNTSDFLSSIRFARSKVSASQAFLSFLSVVPKLVVETSIMLGALGFLSLQTLFFRDQVDISLFALFLIGTLRLATILLPLQRSIMTIVSDHPMAEAAQSVLHLLSPQGNQPAPGASSEVTRTLNVRPAVTGPPGVVARDVTFRYKSSTKNIIQRVSFEVDPGSIVAIVGPSGAGKTTLIELILGLESPTEGELKINSETPKDYRDGSSGVIGYVAQRPGVLSGSVLENIALESKFRPENQERLKGAIEFAELFDWIESLPRKSRTALGQQSEALSGGQLQRIGLARALYTNPKLLIMDEATSALDAETESFITERVLSLRGRITTIIVAHRLSTIRDVDKIFVLDRGKIVGAGTFDELSNSNSVFARYVEILRMK